MFIIIAQRGIEIVLQLHGNCVRVSVLFFWRFFQYFDSIHIVTVTRSISFQHLILNQNYLTFLNKHTNHT